MSNVIAKRFFAEAVWLFLKDCFVEIGRRGSRAERSP
jgi:hypothetical protein